MLQTIVTFLIVFSVIVIIHEFGHYYFARRAGILVREFAIGMGPKILSHRAKDGTTWTIRLLPVGGYVAMAGMGEDETELTPGMPIAIMQDETGQVVKINTSKKVQLANAIPMELTDFDLEEKLMISGYINGDESEVQTFNVWHDATIIEQDGTELRIAPKDVQFQSAKLGQRMMTNFAGPMNNFILAVVLFIIVTFMQGRVPVYDTNQIGTITPDSAAQAAGLQEGDQILSVDDKKIASWDELTTAIAETEGKSLTMEVKRGEETFSKTLTPKKEQVGEQTRFLVGFGVPMKSGLMDKITGGFQQAAASSVTLIKALGNLIMKPDINKLGGPVAIFQMSSEAAAMGPTVVIAFMAMLSMNLGVMNLLPIPALDGGKIVLNIIEGVRGKPLSPEKEGILTLIGFGLLMLLMVLVTWNDIQRYFF